MTTYTGNYVPYCPDTTSLRAWGTAFTDAFDALDTAGDIELASPAINWTTVSAGGPTSTLLAFAVYKFTDTAQTTGAPVFFQVSFNSGHLGQPNYPYVSIHLGVTYSGSGALTSVGSLGILNHLYSSGTSPTSAAREIALSSDGSGLAMSMGWNGANVYGSGVFIIDRFRDEDGLPIADGWAGVSTGTTSSYVTVDPVSGTGQLLQGAWPAIGLGSLGTTTSTLNTAGETTLFPVWVGNRFGTYTLKMAMSYTEIDFSPTPGTFSATILGATRTYRRLGPLRGGFDITNSLGALCSIWWSD